MKKCIVYGKHFEHWCDDDYLISNLKLMYELKYLEFIFQLLR